MSVRVRFLRTKRWPHPDGLRRQAGEIVAITPALAEQWAANGIVETVADEKLTAAKAAKAPAKK